MDNHCPNDLQPSPRLGRLQFGLRHLFVATTGVAVVMGLAAWGGWLHSDAVAYLSIAIVAGSFSSVVRRALLGGIAILVAFWLAMSLGHMVFGSPGRGGDPRSLWIFAGLLTAFAMILRLWTKAGACSLVASLLLTELFTAIVIVYTYGLPTLFQAFSDEHRSDVLQHVGDNLLFAAQWWIIGSWLAGIVFGEMLVSRQKARDRQKQLP